MNDKRYKILFLANNPKADVLYNWISQKCETEMYDERLTLEKVRSIQPDLIVSYSYKFIISEAVIEFMKGRVINLHISYLPWNRGADPNIWSFIENTPKGVTIHQVSKGLDEGKILYQKKCEFDVKEETFTSTYDKLNETIVELFKENWEEIKAGTYILYEQEGSGSYHVRRELDEIRSKITFSWDENIADFLKRYEAINE